MIPFFLALKKNRVLTELDISSQNIGVAGVEYLCLGLEANNSLRKLYWDNNNPTLQGYKRVLQAMDDCSLTIFPIPVEDLSNYMNSWDNITRNEILSTIGQIQSKISQKKEKVLQLVQLILGNTSSIYF